MATIPPPYTPRDAQRSAREAWRAQAAAQRAAIRAQRNYWRGMKRPSIAGPIVLILIGVVAMLIVTGRLNGPAFWMAYHRWWPLLFILVGLTLLLEWFLDRNQPHPIRRSTGGVVFLLLVLAGLTGGATWAHWNWGPLQDQFSGYGQDADFLHFMGAEHDNENQMDMAAPEGAIVQIDNPRGDVVITASPDSQMHIHTREAAYSNSEDEARRLLKLLEPNVTTNGKNVMIHVQGDSSGKSTLAVQLPLDASVSITAGHGDVSIEGLKGETHSTAVHGDIKLENLSGTAHARMTKGDFSAHAVSGDLTIEGRMNDVTLSEIRGKVLLDGDFFGSTHLERIEAPLHLHSSRTDFEIARIAGDLTMDSSDLRLQQAQGPIKIVTRSKAIDCSQVFGDIHIENSNDEVSVNPGVPLGNISINNHNGSINLSLPASASFSVEGRANNGEVSTEFGPEEVNQTGNDSTHTLSGQVGKGGPRIILASEQGDIHLKKGDMVPALPPIPPLPPMPSLSGLPAMPKMPKPPNAARIVKHLRQPPGPAEPPAVQ